MKLITRTGALALCLGILSVWLTAHAQPSITSFLPPHYETALKIKDQPLRFVSQSQKNDISRAVYKSVKGDVSVVIESQACSTLVSCDAIYSEALKKRNVRLTSLGGQFRSVSFFEFTAEWKSGLKGNMIHVARAPMAIVSWTTTGKDARSLRDEEYLTGIRAVINQQRFNEAKQLGNVEFGRWAPKIHEYGQYLLKQGKTEDALAVLSELVAWSPSNFEAKLEFAENAKDEAAVYASALAVWQNAESPALTSRAAHLLGRAEPDAAAVSPLEAGLSGLQVVFIPLAPCDIRLVEEAARIYSASLDVPVKIRRLPDAWLWDRPDRVYRQRDMQSAILQNAHKSVDFTGWTLGRYTKELLATTAKRDALTRYQIRSFLDDLPGKPGQYRSEFYVERLLDSLMPYRSEDRRTMFVGVTEADIYSGENNFLFSGGGSKNGVGASLLSYARMQAAMLNEPNQSRTRLIARLAKEMVPASLKLLGIPRPADPADPYSYSDGVGRLDQKTLTLSAPTREALDRFRPPEPPKDAVSL